MSITIRSASSSDAEAIYSMIRELAAYERAEHLVKATADSLQRQLEQKPCPFECLIAEIEGKPCGFALYFFAYSTWEGSSTLYLEDLYVNPSFRGFGLGAALMRALARTAEERKCSRFEWSVLDWNEPAINFYEQLGARPQSGWTRYRMDESAIQELLR